jgi:RND family efflux transporter MFP subunit
VSRRRHPEEIEETVANPQSSISPNANETDALKPVKAPLGGVIVGVIIALGFVGWTGSRIMSVKSEQKVVAEKRQEEAARTQAALNAPSTVNVVTGSAGTWQPVVQFDGTLQAAQAAGLGFKVSGRIAAIAVKVGQDVKTGAILGRLDANEASAQLRAAEAQIRAAQAQLVIAKDNEKRTTQLVSSGSIAEAAAVQTTQQAALATAQLETATAQAELARVALANHAIVAPFSGTVTKIPDGIGAVVSPGVIQFELVDTSALRLRSTVSEYDANLIAPGAEVRIGSESGPVIAALSAVLGSVDPNTRRVPVEATLKNNGKLRAGSFVDATVHGGAPIDVLKLPHTVLRPGSQNEILVLKDDVLELRHLIYALDANGDLLVRSGLAANEQVVVSPKPETQAGDRVSVNTGASP